LCGFAEWNQRKTPARSEKYHQLQNNPASWKSSERFKSSLPELVTEIFSYLENPILLEDLVNVVAALLGIKDNVTQDEEILNRLPAQAGEHDLSQKDYLLQLWKEICQLSLRQRRALLLNLRDEKGINLILLFPQTGTSSIRQIANALELPVVSFAEMWRDLPMEDAKIAILLNISRQQVINLRKCARERLARRMKAFSATTKSL
jgi:hypothetical protein